MLSKIIQFIKLSVAQYYWQEAMIFASKKNKREALQKLNKSYNYKREKGINDLLLEAYLMISSKNFENMKKYSELGIEKIAKSKSLNLDEKGYLTLYATDLINLAIVHGNMGVSLLSRDKEFNVGNVDERYLRYFPLLDRE